MRLQIQNSCGSLYRLTLWHNLLKVSSFDKTTISAISYTGIDVTHTSLRVSQLQKRKLSYQESFDVDCLQEGI